MANESFTCDLFCLDQALRFQHIEQDVSETPASQHATSQRAVTSSTDKS